MYTEISFLKFFFPSFPDAAVAAIIGLSIYLILVPLFPTLSFSFAKLTESTTRSRVIVGLTGATLLSFQLLLIYPFLDSESGEWRRHAVARRQLADAEAARIAAEAQAAEERARAEAEAAAERARAEAEARERAELEARCRSSDYDVPVSQSNVSATGRSHVLLDGFRTLSGTHRSNRCRERYTITWSASDGHFFYNPSPSQAVQFVRVSGPSGQGSTQPPNSPIFQSGSANVEDSASHLTESRSCGATIRLIARHLPESCRDFLQ